MSQSYVVPLTYFRNWFSDDRPRHEIVEDIRIRLLTEVSRRLLGPDSGTLVGQLATHLEAFVAHDAIVLYSPLDYEEMRKRAGEPKNQLTVGPIRALGESPTTALLMTERGERYPAGNPVFVAAVNSLLTGRR